MNIYFKDLKPFYNIIDLRDETEYKISHVYNSINIPYKVLLYNPSRYLDSNKRYYLYCTSGYRSKAACELLTALGYDVVNVIDGFKK
jgi:rhodanese-related sulfurtransferase